MSLLAESLVEEWLNRAGYFTIRGARFGVSEMDLLAVRHSGSALEARHIEVQVSTNPIAYVSPLTDAQTKQLGKAKTSAWVRPANVLATAVAAWVDKKFTVAAKVAARNKKLAWSFVVTRVCSRRTQAPGRAAPNSHARHQDHYLPLDPSLPLQRCSAHPQRWCWHRYRKKHSLTTSRAAKVRSNPSLHPTCYSGLRPLPQPGELKCRAAEDGGHR
jgi:hypothetical protein